MKKCFLLLLLLLSLAGFSQSVNDYKYAIIPVKFDFQNEANQYRLNSNLKFLLQKQGFTVFGSNDILPLEIAQNKCNAMYVDLVKKGSFLVTRLQVVFKDCQNNVLYSSAEGRSKEKKYELAYREALEGALNSMTSLNYSYTGPKQQEIVQQAKPVTETKPAAVQQVTPVDPVISPKTLFAQPIANGYQLVDNTPKIVLKLVKTSQPNYFMASSEARQGVVYLKGDEWFFDYYQAEKLISEKIEIKF